MKHERQPEPNEEPELRSAKKKYDLNQFEYQTFKKKKKKTTIFRIVFNSVNVLIYIVGLVSVFRYLISLF